jgi:hypothetical protein
MEHDDDEDGGEEGYGGGRTPDQFRELVQRWKRNGGDPPEPMTPDEKAIWEKEKPIIPKM